MPMYARRKTRMEQKKKSITVTLTPKSTWYIILQSGSQKSLGVAGFPLESVTGTIYCTSPSTAIIAECGHGRSPDRGTSLDTQRFPALQLAFQLQCLLALFAQLPLHPASLQLSLRVALVKLLDITEKTLSLIPTLVDLVVELGIQFLAPVNLRLKILDRTVNIAKGTLFGSILVLLFFEVGLELSKGLKSVKLVSGNG